MQVELYRNQSISVESSIPKPIIMDEMVDLCKDLGLAAQAKIYAASR